MIPGIQNFVSLKIGKQFTEPPPFDLAGSYRESSCTSPLLFVLSTGSDPTAALLQVGGGEGRAGMASGGRRTPQRRCCRCGGARPRGRAIVAQQSEP